MQETCNKPTERKVDEEQLCVHRPLWFTIKQSDGGKTGSRCHHRFLSKDPNATHLTFNLLDVK